MRPAVRQACRSSLHCIASEFVSRVLQRSWNRQLAEYVAKQCDGKPGAAFHSLGKLQSYVAGNHCSAVLTVALLAAVVMADS